MAAYKTIADAEAAVTKFDGQELNCNGITMTMRVKNLGSVINSSSVPPQPTPAQRNGFFRAAMDDPE